LRKKGQVKNFFFVDIFLQYRIALTWIYPAVKYAAYRPGDPNNQQEIKKCDQPLGFQRIDNYCGKQKKLVKHSSLTHVQLLERVTTSTGNTNQNFAIDTINDGSLECRKKRKKYSTKMLGLTAVKDDFTRYLLEKKLQNVGIMNLKKYNSNKNIHTSFEFNQFVSIYYNIIIVS
jgi:hypothetical protein